MTFMNLEDPGYAYMFGFLQADGHMRRGMGNKGELSVEISRRDLHILKEFQRLTPYNSTISERTRATNFSASHSSASWTLHSLEARSILEVLGLPYGEKSKRIVPPRVPFSQPDYLRGVIDADGSVGFTSDGLPFVGLTTASTAVAAYLCHYMKRTFGIQRRAGRNVRDGVYNVMYLREAGAVLSAHLYDTQCLALERKRTAALQVGAWVRPIDMGPPRPRRPWTAAEDRALLDAPTLADAAAELGRSRSSCQVRRWRLRQGQQ